MSLYLYIGHRNKKCLLTFITTIHVSYYKRKINILYLPPLNSIICLPSIHQMSVNSSDDSLKLLGYFFYQASFKVAKYITWSNLFKERWWGNTTVVVCCRNVLSVKNMLFVISFLFFKFHVVWYYCTRKIFNKLHMSCIKVF